MSITPFLSTTNKRLGSELLLPSPKRRVTSVQDQAPAAFLGLPRELRDDIYDYLYCSSRFTHTERGVRFIFSYGETSEDIDITSFPLWLLVNKQILSEGISQLYRRARCTGYWRTYCRVCHFQLQSYRRGKCEHSGITNISTPPSRILTMDRIRRIDITANTCPQHLKYKWGHRQDRNGFFALDKKGNRLPDSPHYHDEEPYVRVSPLMDEEPQRGAAVNPLPWLLRAQNACLKDLSLEFYVNAHISIGECGANFSLLEGLGTNLDRVEFRVLQAARSESGHRDSAGWWVSRVRCDKDYNIIAYQVQQELARVAKALVGHSSYENDSPQQDSDSDDPCISTCSYRDVLFSNSPAPEQHVARGTVITTDWIPVHVWSITAVAHPKLLAQTQRRAQYRHWSRILDAEEDGVHAIQTVLDPYHLEGIEWNPFWEHETRYYTTGGDNLGNLWEEMWAKAILDWVQPGRFNAS